jgi:hypothetical protein
MMNKILIRYVLFCIITAAVIFILLKGRSPFGRLNSSFSCDRNREITRIEISGADKEIDLIKNAGKWTVNNEEEARENAIDFMIRILYEIRIKSPVSDEMFEEVNTKKGVTPERIKVFDRRRLLGSFFVYRTESNLYGNIMKKKSGSKPFITYVPGYEGNIGYFFNPDELFWKPYVLFRYLPSEISEVRLEDFSQPQNSFSIIKKGTAFVLTDLERELPGWDTMKVARYLTYLFNIPFERWAPELTTAEAEEIVKENPLFRITVKDLRGMEQIVRLWQRWNYVEGKKVADEDRLWGMTGRAGHICILRYFDIDPLLKKRIYFFNDNI